MAAARRDTGFAGSFLSTLDAEARRALIEISAPHKYVKGDSIFAGDDEADSVFVIVRGRVKIYCLAEEGKELILWFFLAGDLFGIAGTPGQRRGVCARACESADILEIARGPFREFLAQRPDVGFTVMDTLGQRLRTLGDVVQNLASTCVTGRVIRLLQRLGALESPGTERPGPYELPLTHQDIADMIGCCRQSVTETLGVLKRSGAIACERQRVRIIDAAVLEAAVPQGR